MKTFPAGHWKPCDLLEEFSVDVAKADGERHHIASLPARDMASLEDSNFFRQLWHRLKEVSYQAIVGNLENRSICVFVYGNDRLGVLHSC